VVLSLSAGIFVSTHSRNERKAMIFTFLLLLAVTCLPFLVMVWLNAGLQLISEKEVWMGLMFSPGFALLMALFGGAPFFPADSYWYSVALSWVGFLLIAARTAPRSWTEKAAKPGGWRFVTGRNYSARLKDSRRKLLDDNPFLWLALRGEASPSRVWFFVLSIFAIWFTTWMRVGSFIVDADILFPTFLILHVGLKIWIAGEASRRFIEDRRNNAMEFLLSTPLQDRQIIRGQWRALLKQFFWPMVALLLWETVMIFANLHSRYRTGELPEVLSMMFFLPADFVALGWAGMWLGMTSKGRGRAMLTALALVFLLPLLLSKISSTLGPIWAVPARQPFWSDTADRFTWRLAVDMAVIVWAAPRLLRNFRRLAVEGGSR
jgi:hypothetical protein